jgi:hypothetical protein
MCELQINLLFGILVVIVIMLASAVAILSLPLSLGQNAMLPCDVHQFAILQS